MADFSNLGVRAATQLDPYFLQFAPQSVSLSDVQPATLGFVIQPCVTGGLTVGPELGPGAGLSIGDERSHRVPY